MIKAIKYALDHGCSDIHVTQGKPLAVRKNGVISIEQTSIPKEEITGFIKANIPQKYEEFASGNDIDASFELYGRRFRVNAYIGVSGASLAIRVLNEKAPMLDELSLPSQINNFCNMDNGLVLVVGTTGSGKTTTLAAIIDRINRTRPISILSIEEPIEYIFVDKFARITQREVGTHIDSFASATRSAMRQDPDCVLIGELRDLETISNAVTMAETGHLVFATIHAKSAVDTIDRILDVFPSGQQEQIRTQLSSVLRGVVCQKLVQNRHGGRTPIVEILTVDDTISGMIRKRQNNNAINDYMRCQKTCVHIVDNIVGHIKNNTLQIDDIKHAISPDNYKLISSLTATKEGLKLS